MLLPSRLCLNTSRVLSPCWSLAGCWDFSLNQNTASLPTHAPPRPQIRHVEREVVGREPDQCVPHGTGDSNRCGNVNCRALGPSQCTHDRCCTLQQGATLYRDKVWYTYHKGWHPRRIESLLFDNPASFHNPGRDPAPRWVVTAAVCVVDLGAGGVVVVGILIVGYATAHPRMKGYPK